MADKVAQLESFEQGYQQGFANGFDKGFYKGWSEARKAENIGYPASTKAKDLTQCEGDIVL